MVVVDNKEIVKFADSLPDKCTRERARLLRSGDGSWDSRVRRAFAEALIEWFYSAMDMSPEQARDHVYVEGWNPIPEVMRGNPFFGTKMHPDAAIISGDGFSMAIELDHGTKGSQIRNALAKASFSVLLGKFDRAVLLFFWEEGIPPSRIGSLEADSRILKRFQELHRTTLHII